jgi:hypothetical protein
MSMTEDRVKIELVDLAEGYNGDYNSEDETDQRLIRFDVYDMDNDDHYNPEWEPRDGHSYCTTLPVKDTFLYVPLLQRLMKELKEPNRSLAAELSGLTADELRVPGFPHFIDALNDPS